MFLDDQLIYRNTQITDEHDTLAFYWAPFIHQPKVTLRFCVFDQHYNPTKALNQKFVIHFQNNFFEINQETNLRAQVIIGFLLIFH